MAFLYEKKYVTIRFFFFLYLFATFLYEQEKDCMKLKRCLFIGIGLLTAFIVWTILLQYVDVALAGEKESRIGFATFNVWFHQLTGVNMILYLITDWLGLVPIFICLCFAVLGLVQLIGRRSLFKVDSDILLLGIYYILVIVCYFVFEMIPINYRPILIDGRLEASYPSSTTLLVLSVMPTLLLQIYRRANKPTIRVITLAFVVIFSLFMVVGRLVSGVHWITDIIASVLLSVGLFMIYQFLVCYMDNKKEIGGKENGVL